MDEYTRLRTIIEDYLNAQDVELSENEISVYQLKILIDQKLMELRNIQFDSTFKDEINKSRSAIQKIGRVFNKNQSICNNPCESITSSCDGKTSYITFWFEVKNSHLGRDWLTVCKDVDSDQIYFDRNKTDKSFVEKHYDRIIEHFNILEEYSRLYQGGVGNSGKDVKQNITDGFFYINLSSDTYGRTSILTTLPAEIDKEKMYQREWLHRKTLKDIYSENADTILRKIPVDINSLNYTYKTIVREAISKQNVPQYVKRK